MRNDFFDIKLMAVKHVIPDSKSDEKLKENYTESNFLNSQEIVTRAVKFDTKGKFFYHHDHKLYLKGVTYGTFKPQEDGNCYPDALIIEKDFSIMAKHGINSIRTYTVPPPYLLDLAFQYGLHVMIGIPWEQHITFLDSSKLRNSIIEKVRKSVLMYKHHPAVLCYTIGNEIPATIVRWYGKERIEKFLKQLYLAAKEVDPDRLITYVNYPTTEYLDLSFLDFYCFNVYLETPEKLSRYILKLHNLAGRKPLVLAEIGMDSLRNGTDLQAALFAWQIPTVFAQGCAGIFIFAWTDEWWRGGYEIEDWKFGLVDRERRPKPALNVVHNCMNLIPRLIDEDKFPFISVIVCSYNGSATIRDCLEGLQELAYLNYEVIVVNDGSTDDLERIIKSYPVKLITTPNQGLGSARNTGLQYAQGEIIAYLDDDAFPDPQWLNYLALAYQNSNHAGIGGPNLPPSDDGPIATCVANAPGGPIHVLLSDEIAEHIPGCNMSFKKEVLLKIGGFDPIFRIAGDDVDICWQVQKAGYTIGFHPAALVWHRRRNSLKAYWNQQKGYGKAEALLKVKWPEKYNGLGHLSWRGRIYGMGITRALKLKKDKVYYGTWGSALFQSIYEPAQGFWASIPLMPEWHILVGLLGAVACLGFLWSPLLWVWPLFILANLIQIVQASESARKYIEICNKKISLKYRLLIIGLHILQPVARLHGRAMYGLTPWSTSYTNDSFKFLFKFRPIVFTYWSEEWRSAEVWLTDIERQILGLQLKVSRGGDFDNYDLQVYNGLFTKLRMILAIEEHGGGKQYLRLKCRPRLPIENLLYLISPAALGFFAPDLFILIIFMAVSIFLIVRVVLEQAASLSCIYAAFFNNKRKGNGKQ